MMRFRRILNRLANAPAIGTNAPAIGTNEPAAAVKNVIKTFIMQNFKGKLDSPEIVESVLEYLESRKIIREGDIPPAIASAIQQAFTEIKSDPSFVQPKMQRMRLVYPKQMWEWLAQNGGSEMRVPDEFLAGANQRTWNSVQGKWQLKQEMRQWLKEYGRSGRVPPPPEYTSTNADPLLQYVGINNNLDLFNLTKQEVQSGSDKSNNTWEQEPSGVSSEELSQSFLDSYPEFAQQLNAEFGDTADPFALVKNYAFRSEVGGKSKVKTDGGRTRTFQDQRLNFFMEYPEYIPGDLRASMPRTEKEAFTFMYQHADDLTNVLLELISQQSPDVQEYVNRKLSNKTMIGPGGKKQIKGPAQFAVDGEGQTMDIADTRNQPQTVGLGSDESQHDANLQMISAVSGSFKQLANQMRSLAKDVVSYMRRKPQGKSTSRRAAFIEGMINAGMDQIESSIDPSNKDAIANIKKMGLQIDKNLQIDLDNIRWSKLITMEHGARIVNEINESAQAQGQPPVFEPLPTSDSFKFNPTPLLQRAYRNAKEKDRAVLMQTYPALYGQNPAQPMPNAGDPNYAKQLDAFYKDEVSDYYKRVYVTAELAIDEIGKYLLWLASNGKYSKNIIMSFLSLIRTHTGVKSGKYPGNANHPSPKIYNNLQTGNFGPPNDEPDFLPPPTTASLYRFNLLKTAISQVCDLVEMKNIMPYKVAATSEIDSMISQIITGYEEAIGLV